MHSSSKWIPSGPIAFAFILSIMMLAGDVFSGEGKNPVALIYYSFLPAVLWMISNEQKRDAQTIVELRGKLERLEGAARNSTP